MACGRRPYRIYTQEACFPNEVPPCPSGFREVRMEEVPGERSSIDFCFGDFAAKKFRHRRLCEKTEWNMSPSVVLNCCLGNYDRNDPNTASLLCDPNFCFNSRACDEVMKDYCQTEAGQLNEVCGCLLPAREYEQTRLIGAPECVDRRCAQNPRAYKTEAQRQNQCNIVNCIFEDIDFNIEDSNISGDLLRQYCGNQVVDDLINRDGDQVMGGIVSGIITYIQGLDQTTYWTLITVIIIALLGVLVGSGFIVREIFFKDKIE